MYYDRTLTTEFSKLIEPNGNLRWLYEFVRNNKDLDFQIGRSGLLGKNGGHGKKEWISIYRGLSRFLSINPTKYPETIRLDADPSYKAMMPNLYGNKSIHVNFQSDIERLIIEIGNTKKYNPYYNNKKEGFYQNVLSREYGICGDPHTEFVIVDKEAVVGYEDQDEKDLSFKPIQEKYKELQKLISVKYPKRFGKNLEEKAIGKELDFLALDKEGNILLIEYKHGTNTQGIYLSPLQIGLYYDIFTSLPREELDKAVNAMFDQKQKIGLINPEWVKPPHLKEIIPVLIISEYKGRTAKGKFDQMLEIIRKEKREGFLNNLQAFNYNVKNGLQSWETMNS